MVYRIKTGTFDVVTSDANEAVRAAKRYGAALEIETAADGREIIIKTAALPLGPPATVAA